MMNNMKGFTTLTITLVLLSTLVAVSAFIGKVLISDRRIVVNELEYRVSFAAAEKGVAQAIAELKIDPSLRGTGVVSGSSSTDVLEVNYLVDIEDVDVGVTRVTSEATAGNGTRSVITVDVAETGILNPNNGEPPPLSTSGTGTFTGTITIVANPNGGGIGVPVSVWSPQDIDINGSPQTCGLQEYDDGVCGTSYYSDRNNIGPDIVANDADFPDDLVEYTFGVPDTAEGWEQLERRATGFLSNCNGLSGATSGFYIVDGDCEINDNDVGSKENPLLLVVRDGDFRINGNVDFYGFVFVEGQYNNTEEQHVQFNGTARLFGAMVVNDPTVDVPNGTFDLVYDPDVLCTIKNCSGSGGGGGGSAFINFSYIPGSWKDWE